MKRWFSIPVLMLQKTRLVKTLKLLRGQAIKARGAQRVISRSLDYFLKGGFTVKVFTTSVRVKIMGREKITVKLLT